MAIRTLRVTSADELREALSALVEPTQEDGYVNYDLHESIEEPATVLSHENWESAEHLDADRRRCGGTT